MSRKDPAAIIIAFLLSPFVFFYRLIIEPIYALLVGIVGLLWYCYIELPMKIGEIQDQLQLTQYGINILNNFNTQSPIPALLHSISPILGALQIVVGGLLLYYFRKEIIDVLSLVAKSL
jgi:Co/Zn/Cd efflux system component